ncbi:hypothetical protein [Thermosipho globiformans]|uniref:hypothetical protein n=1 Tax=Thermosipho globiformans TaxID=380685 RepID=UPI001F49F323|nr:hypothetical protein [Thermosipho globiformans]
MKILFKYKHWMFIQIIFLAIGILYVFIFKAMGIKPEGYVIGGLAVSLHFISDPNEWAIPLLMLMLADIAFNIEYIEGTFVTHLLSGKSRKKWMINRLINFYLFVVLQFFISFVIITIGVGIIIGFA